MASARWAAIAAAAAAIAGCGLGNGPADVQGPVAIYVSLPLSGPSSTDGKDAADGARLALEQAGGKAGEIEVEARFLDDTRGGAPFDLARVGANARAATSDSTTAAYIGELESEPTRTSAPILNDGGIAQVSPGATAVDLTAEAPGFADAPAVYRPSGRVTFTRVIPSDAVVAAARTESGPDAEVRPALAASSLPAPAGTRFVDSFGKRFGGSPGPYAAYGYEAMAAILDAIEERDTGAQDFRSSVVDSLLKLERPDSILGPYSFTTDGDTTLCKVQVLRGGRPSRVLCPNG